jgi:hypothetical protein
MHRVAMLPVAAVMSLAVFLPISTALAQQKSLKEQLVGTWTLVSSVSKFPDGRTEDIFGPNPRGLLILDANGHFALISLRATLPKFSSNSRMTGTPEENKAIVQGSIVFYGTYTVNEADRTFTGHVEGSTFPNFDGVDQKRSIVSLTAEELKYTNPVVTFASGVVIESAWKRAK